MLNLIKLKWQKYLIGLFILLIVDLGQLVVPIIVAIVIDKIAKLEITMKELFDYFLILILLAILVAILRFFWRIFIFGSSREIERELRAKIYNHILKLHVGYFNETKTGDIMAKATNDLEALRMALSMGILSISDAIIYISFSAIAMFIISFKLTVVSIIPILFIIPVSMILGKIIHDKFMKVQHIFGELSERARETFEGISVIKAYTRENEFSRNFKRKSLDYLKSNLSLAKSWGFYEPIIRVLAGLSIIFVLIFGGYSVINNEITLGKLTAFIAYLNMLVWPMIAIGWSVNLFQRGSASYERIEELLKEKPLIFSKESSYKGEVSGNIEFINLSFKYEDRNVLENISFKINQGQSIGIIGKVGSGKSTILKLLLRLYNPPDGTIILDGVDINDWDLKVLRDNIGYVPQESFIFSLSIRENIQLGKPDAEESEIWEVLRIVEIGDEIRKFSKGIDTVVGEKGITLSGGQKQRLALARALIRKPKILLLDDTFSAVDNRTEKNILNNLREYIKGLTTIIVSHKVSAVMDCDYIVVLENGKIKEKGTHEELMELKGFYYNMYSMQKISEIGYGAKVHTR
ncbi:MAG: ABC transporter ATP-binding protein [candidate division WOR-3 bacterium]|nr:ABC transporter ATP-binding protein/permease [candidate division WOR-3 bacterium]MDW8150243.1 ABC transporter ATP-binding protein [candidate division WOR-3 bacterium]